MFITTIFFLLAAAFTQSAVIPAPLVAPYATSYSAHSINHAYAVPAVASAVPAVPAVAAPLTAAPAPVVPAYRPYAYNPYAPAYAAPYTYPYLL
nr:PREDICTED: vitelline membrane protein Vm26Ab-like [Bemisia tabaci]